MSVLILSRTTISRPPQRAAVVSPLLPLLLTWSLSSAEQNMKSSSFLKFLIILLVVAQQVTARLPGGGVPTLAPLTKRFYKNRLSSLLSSSAIVTAPRCGAVDRSSSVKGNKSNIIVGEPTRFVILLVGWTLGCMFYFPNIMMADSGSPKAVLAAKVGMLASLLFALGGCFGYMSHKIGWRALLPGLLCQVVAIFFMREWHIMCLAFNFDQGF